MATVNEQQAALLEEYLDWTAGQRYRDEGINTFLKERETNRLARNAEAVLLFLDDWQEENVGAENPSQDADGLSAVVRYLLNAEVGDPEVEEWFKEPATTEEIVNKIISEPTLTSYNSEEGYYEDEPF